MSLLFEVFKYPWELDTRKLNPSKACTKPSWKNNDATYLSWLDIHYLLNNRYEGHDQDRSQECTAHTPLQADQALNVEIMKY